MLSKETQALEFRSIRNLSFPLVPKKRVLNMGTARICAHYDAAKYHQQTAPSWEPQTHVNLVCQDTAIKNLALRTTNQKKYLALYRVVEHLQMNQLRKKLEIKVGLACTIMLLVCQAAAMFFQRVLCVSKGLDLSALTHTPYIHTHTQHKK